MVIGILLVLNRKLFILELVEKFPFVMILIASCTGLLSGSIMMGSLDSMLHNE